jgi:hypothetical protein
MTIFSRCWLAVAVIYLICMGASIPANAQSQPRFDTNQQYLEEASRKSNIDINDLEAVFTYTFNSLPDEVKVYPTENYYYFSFYHNGIEYAGNLRLDAYDRDKGILHFAYFNAFTRWNEEMLSKYKQLSKADGVVVEKIAYLKYRVTYQGKTVRFVLNDLSRLVPPQSMLNKNEEYIGPVHDESGLQFFLVYNSKAKVFHYILNNTGHVPEQFSVSRSNKHISIGTRTGFAFYHDRFFDRMILIGIYEGNSMVNNYFDGPFDQLPDNFIKGDQLQKALIDKSPELDGTIDRFGNTDKGINRVLIAPYMHYGHDSDLTVFSNCAASANADPVIYYSCFDAENLISDNEIISGESDGASISSETSEQSENTSEAHSKSDEIHIKNKLKQ